MFIRKSKRLSRIVIAALLLTMFGWLLPGNFTVEKANAATTLKNPIIVKDSLMNSGQNVTWDCVYFGSYPQTEVVNENDSEAIDNFEEMNSGEGEDTLEYLKVSDSKWKSIVDASYDSNGDATVGSERYRRIKAEDATYAWILDDDEELDYEDIYYNWLNTTDYHYFKYEPIKWRVLEVNGSDIFLLADKGLDDQRYNTANVGMTWEKSTIRSWLNGYSASNNSYGKSYTGKGFIDTAFLSSAEKNKIKTTDVVNKDNLFKGTEGGENTKDKIYLLSESEVYQTEAAKSYGFMESRGYVTGEVFDEGRKSVSSTYAAAMGACIGPCGWWLRSPGDFTNRAAMVDGGGTAHYIGNPVSLGNDGAVRPALHLDISSSDNWKYAGTVCSDGTVKEPGSGGDSGEHQHKYTARITKKATCTTPGVKTYTCIGCSSIYTEEIPATGHDWDIEYTVDKEPTYSKTGKKSIHCLNDGCTAKEDSVIIPMLDPDPDMIKLSLGGDLRDEYYYDGEVDQWYSFTLKKDCKVDISFGGSAGSSSYSEWDICLCSDRLENGYPDGALIGKLESAKRGSNIIVNTTEYLSAGTYYIRVRGDFSSSMGWTLISVDQASLVQIAKIKDQTYTGKAISPKINVYGCPDFDGNMDPLVKNDDYKVTYSNNKNVGKAKVTVKGIGDYKGTETQTFRILPKSTPLSKLTSTKKGFTAKWKKQSTQTSGYQIMYATNSKFTSGKKTVTVSSNKTISKKITKLKAKKKYYVKVRTYKKVGNAKYYSSWSKVKTVKTK